MSKIIGIDLGSTVSSVAVFENGLPRVIVNEEGAYGTPSVISFSNDEIKVGSAANRQLVLAPTETIRIIKRFMGLNWEESQEAIKHVQYEVVNRNGFPKVKIKDKEYTPEELSAMILQKMKSIAEASLGEEVTDAVITVPAYFSDASRKATENAGKIAGLNVKRILAEPTSALLASKIDMTKQGYYLVVDFGGATLDTSIADVCEGVIEIKSVDGDTFLGGSNIDKALADHFAKEIMEQFGFDAMSDPLARVRLMAEAERVKIDLSTLTMTDINLPYLGVVDGKPINYMSSMSLAKFNEIITPFVDRVLEKVNNTLKSAEMKGEELTGILLVGGSCRIKLVQEELAKINANLIRSANLDLAVAEGAAIQGDMCDENTNSSMVLLDVIPLNYGIETLGGVMTTMIEGNTTIPCKRTQVFSTAEDNQSAVDIRILNGNRPMASQNKEVGIFRLDGIMPAKRGVPQIEVSFDVNVNGILTVSAKDLGTGKEQHITVQSKGGLSDEEINRMKADAEANADADKKAREVAETLNKAEGLVFSTERTLGEVGEKLSDEDKTEMNGLIDEMKKAIADKDINRINTLEKSINDKWHSMTEKMYANASQSNNAENADDVKDATLEE